jgi:hypothetical protein
LKTFIQILLLIIGACLPFQSNKEYFSILFQLVILKFLTFLAKFPSSYLPGLQLGS